MRVRIWVFVVVLALAASACSSDGSSVATSSGRTPTRTPASPSPTASSPAPLEDVRVRLVPVATLEQPVALAVRAGEPDLYVAEKTGRVVAIGDGEVDRTTVLDVSAAVSQGNEQGLLGIAFSPDGRFLYVNLTDRDGDTRIWEYAMRDSRAAAATRREVLFVDQPYSNHNGGNLAFGPDGYLYIGLGDGGAAGDPEGNAQSFGTLLGKMLRIDPRPSGGDPYGIPSNNPFIGREGARPEIWAFGLRNPWRYAFDRETGDLWIGDVGQNAWEEVDRQPAASSGGENYGWDRLEGSHGFEGSRPPAAVDPVYEYSHDDGACVVTGGFVYRGAAIPDLAGAYLFADFCIGRLEALRLRGDGGVDHAELGVDVPAVTSFGEDANGEIYVLSLAGPVYRLARA